MAARALGKSFDVDYLQRQLHQMVTQVTDQTEQLRGMLSNLEGDEANLQVHAEPGPPFVSRRRRGRWRGSADSSTYLPFACASAFATCSCLCASRRGQPAGREPRCVSARPGCVRWVPRCPHPPVLRRLPDAADEDRQEEGGARPSPKAAAVAANGPRNVSPSFSTSHSVPSHSLPSQSLVPSHSAPLQCSAPLSAFPRCCGRTYARMPSHRHSRPHPSLGIHRFGRRSWTSMSGSRQS